MTQPNLYMRRMSTSHTQVAVFKEINMQLVQVGSDFGTDEDTATDVPGYNRVIHWENDLYAINYRSIWKYDVSNSGDWGPFYDFASHAINDTASAYKMGWTPCSIDGSGVLITAYPTSNVAMRIVRIDKDFNITEDAAVSPLPVSFQSPGQGCIMNAISWRNNVVWNQGGPGAPQINYYDLGTSSITNVTNPAGAWVSVQDQLCIYNDKVYKATFLNTSTPQLLRLDGSSLTDLGTIGAQTGPTQVRQHQGGALVKVGAKLFSFLHDDGVGWECHEIRLDAAGDLAGQANVTSIVLPTSLSAAAGGVETSAVIRVDNITNSGLSPIYEMMVYDNFTEGTSSELYRWNNAPSGVMSLVDVGMDNFRFDRINTNDGTGGGRIWSGSGTLNVSQPCLSLNGSNIDAEFSVYGVGQTGVSLEFLFDKEGEVCNTLGTITSTTSGVLVGNTVTGLNADGFGTLTVTWSAAADGITPGDNPKAAARVFIP